MYYLQVLLIMGCLLVLFRRDSVFLQIQILVWSIGVCFITWRFGIDDQLNFYSNDQSFYTTVVEELSTARFTPDLDWWISSAKLPFTIPAAIFAALGVHPGLALKTVSLLCLLILTKLVLREHEPNRPTQTITLLFLTACGGIGMFYSLLALRETMLMMLVTYFVLSAVPQRKLLSILLIFLLRPHLAAALVVAALVDILIHRHQRRDSINSIGVLGLAVGGTVLGYLLYSVGVAQTQTGEWQTYGHSWGIPVVTRIISNYFGLQFLTARSETVEFSLQSLLVLRVILAETIMIPSLFTILMLTRPYSSSRHSRFVLLAFSIYVGLVTTTDFNSFRQNIPFMSVMGLVVLQHFKPRNDTAHRDVAPQEQASSRPEG